MLEVKREGIPMVKKQLADLFRERLQKSSENENVLRMRLRPYQQEALERFDDPKNFRKPLYLCHARRLGKDALAFYIACRICVMKPNARVYYMLPFAAQAKKIILQGVTLEMQPFISSIVNPKVLKLPRNGELYHYDNSIRFKNGSIIQCIGADSTANVGTNCHCLVVSEAALIGDKTQVEYLIPNVIKAGGRVVIVSSPRFGSWFNEDLLTRTDDEIIKSHVKAKDAYDNDGNRVYSDEELEAAKIIMSEIRYRSEYEVDLTVEEESSIYARSLNATVYIQPSPLSRRRIFIAFDAGISDKTSLTFGAMTDDGKVDVVHHYFNKLQPSKHYSDYIKQWAFENKVNTRDITLVLSHDMKNTLDAGRYLTSRAAFYQGEGWHCVVLSPINIMRSIEICRTALENGDVRIVVNSENTNMVNMMKMYEWKKAPITKEILYIPDHGNKGYSDVCDSFEGLTTCLFLDKYERENTTESGVVFKNSNNDNGYYGKW